MDEPTVGSFKNTDACQIAEKALIKFSITLISINKLIDVKLRYPSSKTLSCFNSYKRFLSISSWRTRG